MKEAKGLGERIAAWAPYAVVVVALLVGVEVVFACQTGDLDQPGPVQAITGVVEAVQVGVTTQLDRLDAALCETLDQLEYACTRGLV